MKWLSVVNFIDWKGNESISVAELILEPWNKKRIRVGKNSGIFPGNLAIRQTRRAVEQVLYRICKTKNDPLAVCICGLDGRLEDLFWTRYSKLIELLPESVNQNKIERRSFDGSSAVHYKPDEESSGIVDLISRIDIKQSDLDEWNYQKIWLLWQGFAQLHRQRMIEKQRKNTKFIAVATVRGSILHQVLTERWKMTDAFGKSFCAVGYGNVCIKPIGWNPNLPFSDVWAALLADEEDKETRAPPTIVWADKPN